MAHSTHIDTSEVERLAVDLLRAPGRVQRRSRGVIKRAGVEIKKGMRADFLESRYSGHHAGTYHPDVHKAIGFDLFDDGFGVEVGVDKHARQGGLGNILAFGTAVTAPIVDHTAALRRELPSVLKHFGDAAEESVFGDRSE